MDKRIDFEIISRENTQIYQVGYVEILTDEETGDEYSEWTYYDQQGFETNRQFTHHDGVGVTATDDQNAEIDKFIEEVNYKIVENIHDLIFLCEENDHLTEEFGKVIIKINGGKEQGLPLSC